MARQIKTIDYDLDNDIFFISNGDKVKASVDVGDFVLDINHRNLVCGIEIMDASENLGVAKEVLKRGSVVESFNTQLVGQLPFSKENIETIRSAMRETVLSGTAQILKQLPVEAAAKTGTAEVVKGSTANSLFTAFAPYNDPQIAITVLIEGTTNQQGLAVRSAYNVLKWYFSR